MPDFALLRYPLALVVLCCAHGLPALAADASALNAAMLSISADDAKDFVHRLADDTFEGREAGSRGNRAAGIYVVDLLKKFGVQPAGPKGSFYQKFDNNQNILAMVEGSDPTLKSEFILVGAHYDHVGYGTARNSFGPTGFIHNGADDNASGVAGLLEVARAVAQLPVKPKRSILFAFWDGEEKGLLGSQHWVDHPTVALNKIPLAINIDMIGRLRNWVTIGGVRTGRGLRRLVSSQNDVPGLALDFTWEIKADSDHHSFYSRNLPILMFHTGMHGDYHRPSDDADKINSEGIRKISQLLFGVVVELADSPGLAGFRRQSRGESKWNQQMSERGLPAPPGRLGVTWDEEAAKTGTIQVKVVASGSAAAKGGIKPGDRILKFAKREVHSADDFRHLILGAKNPVAVAVERAGQAEPVELSLKLPGEPARLGISWRIDDAEPGAVIVNRVTPGSPADLAQLRINDRIHRIGGHEFQTDDQFKRLTSEDDGPLDLEVESAGRVRIVQIPALPPEKAE